MFVYVSAAYIFFLFVINFYLLFLYDFLMFAMFRSKQTTLAYCLMIEFVKYFFHLLHFFFNMAVTFFLVFFSLLRITLHFKAEEVLVNECCSALIIVSGIIK